MSASEPTDAPPQCEPALRAIAMPADANPAGDIFGGWLLSQMDLAGATIATRRAKGRVVTVAITAMTFHRPVCVGDEVSCYAEIVKIGRTWITVRVEVFARRGRTGEKIEVTDGLFTYVAEFEPNVICKHVPDRVEIARVETVDIGRKPNTISLAEGRQWPIVRFLHRFAQAFASTVKGGLHRGNGASSYAADLLQRITEHVHQDHAAPLRYRQLHESAQSGCCCLPLMHCIDGIGNHRQVLVACESLLPEPLAQKIQR